MARIAVTAAAGPGQVAPCPGLPLASLCSLHPGPGYAFVSIQNATLPTYLIFYRDPDPKQVPEVKLTYTEGQHPEMEPSQRLFSSFMVLCKT